jgi:uncharacterized protein
MELRDPEPQLAQMSRGRQDLLSMKQGHRPAEPRMEDVLASIRRAIDENANGAPPDRFGGSMAELRVKLDRPAQSQDNRPARDIDYSASSAGQPSQGFAGILGTRRSFEPPPRQPAAGQRRPEPEPPPQDEGEQVYDGYYGAQVTEYEEPAPIEPYQPPRLHTPQRYLPLPPPPVGNPRPAYVPDPGLMSESSSAATQAAFSQLADTITRRALGDRPIADIAHELLRGMLKEWLDENLPKIVERLVREEIERVVRRPQR